MAVTISLYDHTAKRFADGSNSTSDTYKLMLCSAATFSGANTTLAGITKTELSTANGYTAGGATLSGVTVTQTGNDAAFDANDVTFTASGGTIGPAAAAILYNSTDSGSPPVAFVDFGGNQSAGDGTDFKVIWNASGIVTFTVA
ncbi:MAG: hypothetical protein EBV32_00415 [Proteobacteria bacterium]|uniref:Uncharacterized protein n=1 Tax=Candidatus Fonsibacter lacus TaxID=2576439 RepID=A0A964UXE2_9PROT|nr:hypothetical protein [Candidatus Fonsibacter lacus]